MLQSSHYYRFKITGWPVGLEFPDSVSALDFAPKGLHGPAKDIIKGWSSYLLLYAIYVGTPANNKRYLLKFKIIEGSGETLSCLPVFTNPN